MIKVLNKDVEQTFYRQYCEECHAELEFAFDDTYEGALGARYLKCPVCGREVITELEGLELTSDNIEFPKHFMSIGKNAIDVENEEIQQWIRNSLNKFKEGKAQDFSFYGTGNTFMITLEMADEYCIYVMKNYWDCCIPKENINKL